MNMIADISVFENMFGGYRGCYVFNDEFDDLRKESKMHKSRNRWRNSLIGILTAAALAGGGTAGLDYMGGHKNDLPIQPTAGLEQVADVVHGGLNTVRGTVDSSKLDELAKKLGQAQVIQAYAQAMQQKAERENARLKGQLSDTTIAKENWKQADLNRGKQDVGFGEAFKQELKNNYGSIIAKLLRGVTGTN